MPATDTDPAVTAPTSSAELGPTAEPSGTGLEATTSDESKKTETQISGEQKLSGRDLKLKQKAEKQARRAQEKAARGEVTTNPDQENPASAPSSSKSQQQQQHQRKPAGASSATRAGPAGNAQSQRVVSLQRNQQQQSLTTRRGSQTLAQRPLVIKAGPTKDTAKSSNEVGLFGHLYGQIRRQTIEGVSKDVHPAVLALGFQISNYVICGSNARCVAMLLAFKQVCYPSLG